MIEKISLNDIIYDDEKDMYTYIFPKNSNFIKKKIKGSQKQVVYDKAARLENELNKIVSRLISDKTNFGQFVKIVILYEKNIARSTTIECHYNIYKSYIYKSKIDIDVTELTADDIVEFVKKLNKEINTNTMSEVKRLIQYGLALCNEYGFSDISYENIEEELKTKTRTESKIYLLTSRQYTSLENYLKDKKRFHKPIVKMILLSLQTGLLLKDLSIVKYSDVRYKIYNNRHYVDSMFIESKNDYFEVTYPCSKWLAESIENGSLNSPASEHFNEEAPLFLTIKGTKLSMTYILHFLYEAADELGLPKGLNSLTLRYTYIDRNVKNDEDLKKLAKRYRDKNHFGEIVKTYNELKKQEEKRKKKQD